MFSFTDNKMILVENNVIVGFIEFENNGYSYTIIKVYVDPLFRGQNKANILMSEFYNFLDKNGYLCKNVCSYAEKWFERNVDKHNVLVGV